VLGQSLVLVNSELNTAVLACALTPTTVNAAPSSCRLSHTQTIPTLTNALLRVQLWRASHRLFMLSPGKQVCT
jgi:hypothetical protein